MMKRITIKASQVGMVIKNRKVKSILHEGTHWIFSISRVEIHEVQDLMSSEVDIDILMQSPKMVKALEVLEVPDNHLALLHKNGKFYCVLQEGKYGFWKDLHPFSFRVLDRTVVEIPSDISNHLLQHTLMRPFVRQFNVHNAHNGVLFVDGKFHSILKPGTYHFWNNAISMELQTVDLRRQHLEISGQELLTKDKAGIRINFFVQYRVEEIKKAVIDNKDFQNQLYVLMQLSLRAYIGGFNLDELLSKKDQIAEMILAATNDKIKALGVEVSDAGIRDIILPGDMKDIMNQVLVAEKKAQANSIMRREETASTRSLLNTAKLMQDNEMLWKLKEMEYVEKISERIGEITISGRSNVVNELKEIFVK
ncbi:MAG: slipin family protein [Cryomorphaceae bacterium]|nr:slipin family protein [Cryomorphaceae bacterium]